MKRTKKEIVTAERAAWRVALAEGRVLRYTWPADPLYPNTAAPSRLRDFHTVEALTVAYNEALARKDEGLRVEVVKVAS
jgi:hypothetical protein